MAQRTDVEAPPNPPAEKTAAPETQSPAAAAAPPTPPAPKEDFFRSRPRARMYMIGAVLVLLVAGFFLWRYMLTYESTDDAQVDGHLMPLSARISGYVLKVNVNDNQEVKAGDVLIEIDPHDYETAVEQARASVADAEASAQALNITVPITSVNTSSVTSAAAADVADASAGVKAAQQQFDAAQAQLTQTQANDVKVQNDLARYKSLVDKQEISQQMYDQAEAAAKASTAGVVAARATAEAAAQQVAQARSHVAQTEATLQGTQTGPRQVASSRSRALAAEANVQAKQAALDQAELNLQYTKIVAPVDGVIMKNVEVGMNVQPGQQLLTIIPLDDVWVTADFKETQLRYMRPHQPVDIKVDSTDRTYKGHVDSISGSSGARLSLLPPENATGNYVKVVQRVPVKIILDQGQNADHLLRLGMSVEPKVWVK
jgi:membrane fusion protein, multidrug efflux system